MTKEQYQQRRELREDLLRSLTDDEHSVDACMAYLDAVRERIGKVSRSDIKFVADTCL